MTPQGTLGDAWRPFCLSPLGGNSYGIRSIEAGDAAEPHTVHKAAPQQKIIWPRMSMALRFRSLAEVNESVKLYLQRQMWPVVP